MTTTLDEKAIISAQVPADVRDQLLALAEKGDRSLSAEIKRAVVEHLERVEGEKTT